MRTHALIVIALLALPVGSEAQRLPRPRIGRGTPPQAAPLPPEAPAVARALAYRRSRWSGEAYSLINSVQIPTADGGATSYTNFGAGTRGDYRYTDRLSATVDLTVSALGSPVTTETAEVGTRFRPAPMDQALRPFFDVRAAYMHMYDLYAMPIASTISGGGPNHQFVQEARYSRGFGSVVGAGLEYSLTRSLSLTTELTAMRNRMRTYRLIGPANVPNGSTYWTTSFRYSLGLKFNPVRALYLAQNPRL
jgi:hypothetical protein